MDLLILGVIMWSLLHLLRSFAPNYRNNLIEALGKNAYFGIFALAIVASLIAIVFGWRASLPDAIYQPPVATKGLTLVLMLVGLILFFSSRAATNINQWIRHPQLTGVVVWSLAHLLANGDQRSLVLFGGLGVWAIINILAINKREGAWVKPEKVSLAKDLRHAMMGVIIFAVVMFVHPWISGVTLTTL